MISIMSLHPALDNVNRILRDCEKEGGYIYLKLTSPDGEVSEYLATKVEIAKVVALPKNKAAS